VYIKQQSKEARFENMSVCRYRDSTFWSCKYTMAWLMVQGNQWRKIGGHGHSGTIFWFMEECYYWHFTPVAMAEELFNNVIKKDTMCSRKCEIPQEFLLHSKREEYSSIFQFTDNKALFSYVQKSAICFPWILW
jgi:hypothetical protein